MPASTVTESPAEEGGAALSSVLGSPPHHSTRLENLIVEPDGVSFDLDGRHVALSAEEHPEDASVFQGFYAHVSSDLLARTASPPHPPANPGWLSRVRTWLGRWFNPPRKEPSADPPALVPSGPAAEAAPTSKPVRSPAKSPTPATATRARALRPAPAGTAAVRDAASPPSAPTFYAHSPAATQTRTSSIRKLATTATPATEAAGHGSAPLLRAAYADASGVHLLWIVGARGETEKETELVYPHGSEAGHLLQGCYEHLSRLGYPVADLAPWSTPAASPAPSAAQPRPTPAAELHVPRIAVEARSPPTAALPPASPPKPTPILPRGEVPTAPSFAPTAAGAKTTPASPDRLEPTGGLAASPETNAKPPPSTFVMRLHPTTSDHPGRAVVSPVEDASNLQVVLAPERLVRALHAAADPRLPDTERLTYLRCTVARGGLKIAAVGLGANSDAPAAPRRWEELDAWWSAAQKRKDAEKDNEPAAAAAPPSASSARGADPELF